MSQQSCDRLGPGLDDQCRQVPDLEHPEHLPQWTKAKTTKVATSTTAATLRAYLYYRLFTEDLKFRFSWASCIFICKI